MEWEVEIEIDRDLPDMKTNRSPSKIFMKLLHSFSWYDILWCMHGGDSILINLRYNGREFNLILPESNPIKYSRYLRTRNGRRWLNEHFRPPAVINTFYRLAPWWVRPYRRGISASNIRPNLEYYATDRLHRIEWSKEPSLYYKSCCIVNKLPLMCQRVESFPLNKQCAYDG